MNSISRAAWTDDESAFHCTKCRVDFGYRSSKHHCRKCGLIFCNDCSRNKVIIPQDELVSRPTSWLKLNVTGYIISDEDNYRCPHRVCDNCYYSLRDLQPELRQMVARANQETIMESTSKLPNLPSIDFHLENEIRKATTMLFCLKNTLGEEKIPAELLEIAKGVVFFTIIKAGFMFTGRYGTGLVIAKLPNGRWSAPSAVVLSGVGWGMQIGAELTDVMLILSTDQAVNVFKSRAQISVGAELGVSVGPVGRSIESDVTAGSKGAAHAFSYAQSKGLFFGASLEASGIASRPDVNRAFYGEKVSVSALLCGAYPRPKGVEPLVNALDEILNTSKHAAAVAAAARMQTNGFTYHNSHNNNHSDMVYGGGGGGGGGGVNRGYRDAYGEDGDSDDRLLGINGSSSNNMSNGGVVGGLGGEEGNALYPQRHMDTRIGNTQQHQQQLSLRAPVVGAGANPRAAATTRPAGGAGGVPVGGKEDGEGGRGSFNSNISSSGDVYGRADAVLPHQEQQRSKSYLQQSVPIPPAAASSAPKPVSNGVSSRIASSSSSGGVASSSIAGAGAGAGEEEHEDVNLYDQPIMSSSGESMDGHSRSYILHHPPLPRSGGKNGNVSGSAAAVSGGGVGVGVGMRAAGAAAGSKGASSERNRNTSVMESTISVDTNVTEDLT